MYVVIYCSGTACTSPMRDLKEAIIKAESVGGKVCKLTQVHYKATYKVVDEPVQIVYDDE